MPIAGFPHTGNIFGAGAAVEAEYTIEGHEYGGFPPPLEHVNFYLPAGAKLHPERLPDVPGVDAPEPAGQGPKACPKGSAAGPEGAVEGFVAFGKEVVPEPATIESFYAARRRAEFFTFGHEPVCWKSSRRPLHEPRAALYSKKLEAEVPLVETVPGAQDASVKFIKVKAGSALQEERQSDLLRHDAQQVPEKLPAGQVRTDVRRLGGLPEQTVTRTRRRARGSS